MWLEEVRAAATSVSFWSRTEFPSENVWVRCAFGNDYMRGCSLFNLPCLLGLRVFTTDSPWKPKLIKFEKRIPPERVASECPEEQGCRSRLSEGVIAYLIYQNDSIKIVRQNINDWIAFVTIFDIPTFPHLLYQPWEYRIEYRSKPKISKLFTVSKSIEYRTSNIEYRRYWKIMIFLSLFRR